MEVKKPVSSANCPILLIEPCNFENYPLGGTLSFAKQMMGAFGNQLILVGITTDKNTPVGKWTKKEINNITYDFFAIRRADQIFKKPWYPDRIKNYFATKFYKSQIKNYASKVDNVFLQSPESLLAIKNWNYNNICFRAPGVGNMLLASRFWYSRYFVRISEILIYKALKRVNKILASADRSSIDLFIKKSNGLLNAGNIVQFPTRMDTSIFRPADKSDCRSQLKLSDDMTMIVTTGRISEQKGWKFMIDCFLDFSSRDPRARLFFLGDGEERQKVEAYTKDLSIENKVIITGSLPPVQIASYLNAADLYIMGSYIEGWATSLMEAITCARPVCITNFSSATDMVEEGKNGFVIFNRDKEQFVCKMHLALKLKEEDLLEKSRYFAKFSLSNLKDDILNLWRLS